ncbi:terpenoid cyclases/protein prenyltransferase alpha-alpha toroid [Pelagophyceae sp. CCMP2097]|nr:terpenoid cyclases/protein prenyltransferase alpha-alpha toroid [Pelagophyceae sp. CCMP2097]
MASSATLEEQQERGAACERACSRYLIDFESLAPRRIADLVANGVVNDQRQPRLLRDAHVRYLARGLRGLGASYVSLDASRPWLIYWILHSMDVLDALPAETTRAAVDTLKSCQNARGGFGGGPTQLSHCAPTYAACLALALISTAASLSAVDRPALYKFFMSMKHESGGFRMHDDGEIDVRGTYTVVCIAALYNMLTPELVAGVAEYALSCQTYEGGFGGEPGVEAHGGYVFCAVAALEILDETARMRIDDLERWLAGQKAASAVLGVEGGFQGRTNKLVDGCYSFWTGAALVLVDGVRRRERTNEAHSLRWPATGAKRDAEPRGEVLDDFEDAMSGLDAAATTSLGESAAEFAPRDEASATAVFDAEALQRYILLCAQDFPDGGLRDKPGKGRDYYHTCYCLSGLAISQHSTAPASVYGDAANLVEQVHPVFNIRLEKVDRALDFFAAAPATHAELMQ